MGNRYKDPEPCGLWGPDGQCGAAETRRFINGWYCPIHTPYVLEGKEEPQSRAHLYTQSKGFRSVDMNEVIRQKRRARIDGKRHGT